MHLVVGGGGGFCSSLSGLFSGCGGQCFFFFFFFSDFSVLTFQKVRVWGMGEQKSGAWCAVHGSSCKVQRGWDAVQPWTQTQKFRGMTSAPHMEWARGFRTASSPSCILSLSWGQACLPEGSRSEWVNPHLCAILCSFPSGISMSPM